MIVCYCRLSSGTRHGSRCVLGSWPWAAASDGGGEAAGGGGGGEGAGAVAAARQLRRCGRYTRGIRRLRLSGGRC